MSFPAYAVSQSTTTETPEIPADMNAHPAVDATDESERDSLRLAFGSLAGRLYITYLSL